MKVLVAVVFFALIQQALCQSPFVVYEWKFLNFTFPTYQEYEQYLSSGNYKNCMLAGVKVSPINGDVFVSVPRWKSGVPATMNKIVIVDGSPQLQPYPSWAMNQVGDVDAFQSVLGFEIDPKNRLWVLDQGRVVNVSKPGSMKLVIIDLNTDKIIQKYVFSDEEAPLTTSFLNDVVVDMKNGFGYITDTGNGNVVTATSVKGALLVYNMNTNTARRILDSVPSVQNVPNMWITINHQKVWSYGPIYAGADGIALSPDTKTLFYCPLTGHTLYAIDTQVLRNFSASEAELEKHVRTVLQKGFASDGISCSNEEAGNTTSVYMTALERSAIIKAVFHNDADHTIDYVDTITYNNKTMIWPDTIGWNHYGSLYFVSNKLYQFAEGLLDFSEINYRIWGIYVDANSYMDP